jgi:hypothetical protein
MAPFILTAPLDAVQTVGALASRGTALDVAMGYTTATRRPAGPSIAVPIADAAMP